MIYLEYVELTSFENRNHLLGEPPENIYAFCHTAHGYTWDFTSKMIKRLRLSLTAQNVFCITGYSGVDPEVALSGLEPGMESLSYYPRTTEFTFGVNIVF